MTKGKQHRLTLIRKLSEVRMLETLQISSRGWPSNLARVKAEHYVRGYNTALRKMREIIDREAR